MGHEKPEACGDRPPIYKICGRDHHTDNHTCNMLTCKARKRKRCLHDSVKCGNYTSIGWENKHRASSPSCRYKKIIIATLAGKRFERRKKTAILSFKGVIIQKNNSQQPAIDLIKDVDDTRKQRASRPDEDAKFDVEMEEGVETKKGDPTSSSY